MNLEQLTRELGKAIQSDESYIAYEAAKKLNDEDTELQNLIGNFNLIRIKLNQEMAKEDKNEDTIKELNAELRTGYSEVMGNKNMIAFNSAKAKYDETTEGITAILNLCITGEDPETCEPSSCGGSCSSCSGCH